MPDIERVHIQRRLDICQDTLRRIHDDVLPRSRSLIDRTDESLSDSIDRETASTKRILDPDGNKDA